VPLAYRAGSEKKARVHIFWQKRIRSGDTTTPWWYPSQTSGGALAEGRLALPIPPGKHWSDELPLILPGTTRDEQPKLEGPKTRQPRRKPEPKKPASDLISEGGMKFDFAKPADAAPAKAEKAEKAKRERKRKAKNDPKLVAAARELKDRWLEHVNAGGMMLESAGKYELCRTTNLDSERPLTLPSPGGRGNRLPVA
jgi:hypothetical protein